MLQFGKSYFDELTKEKIQNILTLINPILEYRKQLYFRYARKNNLYETMQITQNRIINAFEYYIVNMAQGYLSGKEPTYEVKGSDLSAKYQEAIDYIRRYNDDAATFTELMHDYLITTSAYLYISENEKNEIVYTRIDSRNSICVYDYGTPPYPIAFIKKWVEKEIKNSITADITKLEIITKKSRRIYNEKGDAVLFEDYNDSGILTKTIEKLLHWNDVPITAFENPDGISVFEPAIGLIDTYENLTTNIRNMTQYNDNAKLKVKGYTYENEYLIGSVQEDGTIKKVINPARELEDKALYESKTIYLPNNDGDVSWLIKDVDYSGVLSILKQLHDMITMLTGVPNMTDEAFSNADNASALGYKLYALDQYSATVDRIFKKGYLRLWEIITNRLNLKGANYNFRDIDITFSRNVPTDKDKSIQRAVTAKNAGLTSLETAINISGIEVDAESEIERIKDEQAYEYEDIRKRISIAGTYESNNTNIGGAKNDI